MRVVLPVTLFWVCVLTINITFTVLFRNNQISQSDISNRNRFEQDVKSFQSGFQDGLDDILKAHKTLIVNFNISAFPTPKQMDQIESYNKNVLKNEQTLYYAQYVDSYEHRVSLIDELRTIYNDSSIDVTIFNGTLQRTKQNRTEYFLVKLWSPFLANTIYGFDLMQGTVPKSNFDRIKQGKVSVNFRNTLSTLNFRYGAVVYLPVNQSGRLDILGSVIDVETIFRKSSDTFENICFSLDNDAFTCEEDTSSDTSLKKSVFVTLSDEPVKVDIYAKRDFIFETSSDLFNTSIIMISVQIILFIGFIYMLYRSRYAEKTLLVSHARQDARNQFIAYIFHEVRVPLQAILATFELLMEDIPKDYKKIVSSGLSSCFHMSDLLNNVLELSRLEKKMDRFNDQWISLPKVFEPTVLQFDVYCRHASKRFEMDMDSKLKNVLFFIDASKIKQAASNLINNAVKYTPQNGTIFFRIIALNTGFRLEVEDTGVGISDDGKKKLFLPYSQVQGTAQSSGTGLGLSIVRYITEHYKGSYDCESSNTKRGTLFRIDFPVESKRTSHSDLELGDIRLNDTRIDVIPEDIHILIVEDDDANRMILSRFFSKKGCKVMVACDGQEAVEMTQEHKFSCIIMDKTMPRLNGDQAADKIRKQGVKTPIVALTGNALDHEVELFKKKGAQIVLTKPVELKELYDCVLSFL